MVGSPNLQQTFCFSTKPERGKHFSFAPDPSFFLGQASSVFRVALRPGRPLSQGPSLKSWVLSVLQGKSSMMTTRMIDGTGVSYVKTKHLNINYLLQERVYILYIYIYIGEELVSRVGEGCLIKPEGGVCLSTVSPA